MGTSTEENRVDEMNIFKARELQKKLYFASRLDQKRTATEFTTNGCLIYINVYKLSSVSMCGIDKNIVLAISKRQALGTEYEIGVWEDKILGYGLFLVEIIKID